jgi:class 3 adenylate cyclase/tetratricopeptide (TPR) repeat protein
MKCRRCQHDNEAGAKFCEECAAPLALACARCGRKLSPTAKFCPECAHPTAPSAESSLARRLGPPESYTPKHLAERILTSKTALEGERKQVTVLFADLKGSMELLAGRDPEEARNVLDPVLTHMMEAVHRYEGTVNQVMGDGIMALFGAPVAHEDHAARACYAALRMQEAVKRYAEHVHRTDGARIRIRVGLNSGEVVVRSIGSDLRMDYTAVGETTHLAARMEQLADPGAILLTPATLALAEGYVIAKSLGPVPVKGLADAVEVYELTGAGLARTRLQATARHGLTRFVGRDAEVEQLRRAQQLAENGHGQVAAIVGEAGVGKSRLVYEFTHSHCMQGWLTLESRAASYGKAISYLPMIDLLKVYFRIEPSDGSHRMSEKVAGRLLALDEALRPTLPAFLSLLDLPVGEPTWQTLDPPQRRRYTLDAVKHLLRRESQVRPLLVVCEDLHWIDGETQALLDNLIESLPTSRILMLVNYRPEYKHAWGSKSYYRQLQIDPLPPESADELVRALLGSDPTLDALTRLLIERTDGNPLFLEESVRTLIETHALTGQRGAYRLTGKVTGTQIAPTVQAVLAARIDRLSPEHKRLLQTAAVIGKDVPIELLRAVADEPEAELRSGLAQLGAAEFLYETRLFPEPEYTFRHALTHDVAYATVLHDRRRALHAGIVEAIEQLYPERLLEHLEQLSRHALLAEQWEKAVDYSRRAGMKAAARSAHREAAAHFELALSALSHLTKTDESLRLAIDLKFDVRNSLMPLGEVSAMLRHLREAEALAEGLGDRRRLGHACTLLTNAHVAVGDYQQAVRSACRALEIADDLGDLELQGLANFRLGQANLGLGRYADAIVYFGRTAATLTRDRMRERLGIAGFPAALSRSGLAMCLAETGDFAAAMAVADEGLRMAEALEQPFTLTFMYAGLAHVSVRRGEMASAISTLERGLGVARERDVPVFAFLMASHLVYVHALSGHPARTHPWLDQLVAQAVSEKFEFFRTTAVASLAEACRLSGRTGDADRLASHALDVARARHELGGQTWLLQLSGKIAADRDPPDQAHAQTHYRKALDVARELGMRPLVAHCHLGLGKLYRRSGRLQQAPDPLTTAAAMYREMDMRLWLDEAEAEVEALHEARKGFNVRTADRGN